MSSSQQPIPLDVRAPLRLARWKILVTVGAVAVLSPVIGLVLAFFLLSALPIIPVLAPLVLVLGAGRVRRHTPSTPARPTIAPSPWPSQGAVHA